MYSGPALKSYLSVRNLLFANRHSLFIVAPSRLVLSIYNGWLSFSDSSHPNHTGSLAVQGTEWVTGEGYAENGMIGQKVSGVDVPLYSYLLEDSVLYLGDKDAGEVVKADALLFS